MLTTDEEAALFAEGQRAFWTPTPSDEVGRLVIQWLMRVRPSQSAAMSAPTHRCSMDCVRHGWIQCIHAGHDLWGCTHSGVTHLCNRGRCDLVVTVCGPVCPISGRTYPPDYDNPSGDSGSDDEPVARSAAPAESSSDADAPPVDKSRRRNFVCAPAVDDPEPTAPRRVLPGASALRIPVAEVARAMIQDRALRAAAWATGARATGAAASAAVRRMLLRNVRTKKGTRQRRVATPPTLIDMMVAAYGMIARVSSVGDALTGAMRAGPAPAIEPFVDRYTRFALVLHQCGLAPRGFGLYHRALAARLLVHLAGGGGIVLGGIEVWPPEPWLAGWAPPVYIGTSALEVYSHGVHSSRLLTIGGQYMQDLTRACTPEHARRIAAAVADVE